jgi:hypothetical protein
MRTRECRARISKAFQPEMTEPGTLAPLAASATTPPHRLATRVATTAPPPCILVPNTRYPGGRRAITVPLLRRYGLRAVTGLTGLPIVIASELHVRVPMRRNLAGKWGETYQRSVAATVEAARASSRPGRSALRRASARATSTVAEY